MNVMIKQLSLFWRRYSPKWPNAHSTNSVLPVRRRVSTVFASCLSTSSTKRSTSSYGFGSSYWQWWLVWHCSTAWPSFWAPTPGCTCWEHKPVWRRATRWSWWRVNAKSATGLCSSSSARTSTRSSTKNSSAILHVDSKARNQFKRKERARTYQDHYRQHRGPTDFLKWLPSRAIWQPIFDRFLSFFVSSSSSFTRINLFLFFFVLFVPLTRNFLSAPLCLGHIFSPFFVR